MNRLVRLFGASIGRKLVVAATGVLLIAFLIGHLFGNLKILQGREALNSYADWLQGHPLVWLFRVGLLTIFVVHIYATLSLARENRAARPVRYHRYRPQTAGFASRYMLLSGLVILAFLLFHLAHFTFGVVDPRNTRLIDEQGRLDVYSSVARSFRNPWIAWTYVGSMLLLGLHLAHGIASTFQTMGVHHESYTTLIWIFALALLGALVIGNCAIPLLVLSGRIA
jgi:succinate dehydrogenase / fumarate reductase cytochrome b subunit